MSFLKKRETPVQNIAYIAIMAAINVVFVLISNLLPVLFFLLVFILPLTSVIVTVYCKKLYLPIYAVASLLLCFGVSFGFSIFDTFIYVLPSLITGILFGLCIEYKMPAIYMITLISVVQYLLTSLTFLFIDKVVAHVNFFESMYTLIGLQNFPYKWVLTNIFTYLVAQIQIIITYVLVKYEMRRANIEINLEFKHRFILYLVTGVIGIITLLSVFFFSDYSVLFTLLALPLIVYMIFDLLLKQNVAIYISLGLITLTFFFLFAFFYQYVSKPNHLVILFFYFIGVTIIDFLFNYCFKAKSKNIE